MQGTSRFVKRIFLSGLDKSGRNSVRRIFIRDGEAPEPASFLEMASELEKKYGIERNH